MFVKRLDQYDMTRKDRSINTKSHSADSSKKNHPIIIISKCGQSLDRLIRLYTSHVESISRRIRNNNNNSNNNNDKLIDIGVTLVEGGTRRRGVTVTA